MKITIFGIGYVGIVTGACFAEMGNEVTCIDTDRKKIEELKSGIVPIFEPGLDYIIERNTSANRLFFTNEALEAVKSAEVIFICVGTPMDKDGSANCENVFISARDIGKLVEGYTVIVTKSTIPMGTTRKVGEIVNTEISLRGTNAEIDTVNNPEFLKEGSAIADFMTPDRIVIGTESKHSADIMHRLYAPFLRTEDRIIFMSIESSELTKYASNAMLATRISFMNEIALLAEQVGADIEEIRLGMARDKRIGKFFLYSGAGYGGSCFSKDTAALIYAGRQIGCEMRVVKAVDEVNNFQKRIMAEKIRRFFDNNLTGKKIAVWGLAFKPQTDDVREAPAIEVIRMLRGDGATLEVHDPIAITNTHNILGDDSIAYHSNSYDALNGANALVIMTEWKEYRTPDWKRMHSLMCQPVVFDGRNIYDPEEIVENGFRYFGIGHGESI